MIMTMLTIIEENVNIFSQIIIIIIQMIMIQ